jgi:toxin-antitoxin system PIN domain toxin
VNVLVALFDPDHIHHEIAHDWFAEEGEAGWATCATTENGFIRVLSNPNYGSAIHRPVDLVDRLRTFCKPSAHAWWTESISLHDKRLFDPGHVRGHRQITDVYLLGLARKMGGRLATFDRTIPLRAVVGATAKHLAIIAPAD